MRVGFKAYFNMYECAYIYMHVCMYMTYLHMCMSCLCVCMYMPCLHMCVCARACHATVCIKVRAGVVGPGD